MAFLLLLFYSTEKTIWDLPNVQDEQIDIGFWSLVIAKEYDPKIDIDYYSRKIDSLADTVRKILPTWEKDTDLLYAVKVVLYDGGQWNNFSPVSYDLKDPLGKITENRFLPTYLDTKKGNCITMPNLVIAVLNRIDPEIPISCVLAPLHTFCRLQDRKTGLVINFEATNGNSASDEWIIEQNYVPQKGIDSGLYMRMLSKKEYLGVLLESYVTYFYYKGNIEKAVKYNDLVLELFPSHATALASKAFLVDEQGLDFVRKVNMSKRPITMKDRDKAYKMKCEAEKYYKQALDLGWKPPTEEEKDEYKKTIQEERNKKH